jgi:hypothetical protein
MPTVDASAPARAGPPAASPQLKTAAQVKASAAPASDPAGPYVALALQRLHDGRLIEPGNDSARFFVQQALQSNPASDAAERASETLALALLNAAHGAIDRQDFKAAAGWLDAAEGIASATNVDNLRRRLAAAERQADSADPVPPTMEQPPPAASAPQP